MGEIVLESTDQMPRQIYSVNQTGHQESGFCIASVPGKALTIAGTATSFPLRQIVGWCPVPELLDDYRHFVAGVLVIIFLFKPSG